MKLCSMLLGAAIGSFAAFAAHAAPPLPGAVFTTDAACLQVNGNIYASKDAVYLNGGPAHPGAAGFSRPGGVLGYDDTPNPGGEYKVWVSTVADFSNESTKTDNFKVKTGDPVPNESNYGIQIRKWYDRNTDGEWTPDEPELSTSLNAGWKVDLLGFAPQFTAALYEYLDPIQYTAREYRPLQSNWLPTYPVPTSSDPTFLNKTVTTASTPAATVLFGNVCVGAGGGLTLGYWSNKNGEADLTRLMMSNALAALTTLNLADSKGNVFDPGTYAALKKWLLDGNAVNMAYMLSVQLAAMKLNVLTNKVNRASLIYAPGATGANSAGFISVNALMDEANASLGDNSKTFAGVPQRVYQEYLKNGLDRANNNKTFVQFNPCTYTFSSN